MLDENVSIDYSFDGRRRGFMQVVTGEVEVDPAFPPTSRAATESSHVKGLGGLQIGHREGQMEATRGAHVTVPSQSLAVRNSVYRLCSGEPGFGCQSYFQWTTGGNDISMDSVLPPDCRPNRVPLS